MCCGGDRHLEATAEQQPKSVGRSAYSVSSSGFSRGIKGGKNGIETITSILLTISIRKAVLLKTIFLQLSRQFRTKSVVRDLRRFGIRERQQWV